MCFHFIVAKFGLEWKVDAYNVVRGKGLIVMSKMLTNQLIEVEVITVSLYPTQSQRLLLECNSSSYRDVVIHQQTQYFTGDGEMKISDFRDSCNFQINLTSSQLSLARKDGYNLFKYKQSGEIPYPRYSKGENLRIGKGKYNIEDTCINIELRDNVRNVVESIPTSISHSQMNIIMSAYNRRWLEIYNFNQDWFADIRIELDTDKGINHPNIDIKRFTERSVPKISNRQRVRWNQHTPVGESYATDEDKQLIEFMDNGETVIVTKEIAKYFYRDRAGSPSLEKTNDRLNRLVEFGYLKRLYKTEYHSQMYVRENLYMIPDIDTVTYILRITECAAISYTNYEIGDIRFAYNTHNIPLNISFMEHGIGPTFAMDCEKNGKLFRLIMFHQIGTLEEFNQKIEKYNNYRNYMLEKHPEIEIIPICLTNTRSNKYQWLYTLNKETSNKDWVPFLNCIADNKSYDSTSERYYGGDVDEDGDTQKVDLIKPTRHVSNNIKHKFLEEIALSHKSIILTVPMVTKYIYHVNQSSYNAMRKLHNSGTLKKYKTKTSGHKNKADLYTIDDDINPNSSNHHSLYLSEFLLKAHSELDVIDYRIEYMKMKEEFGVVPDIAISYKNKNNETVMMFVEVTCTHTISQKKKSRYEEMKRHLNKSNLIMEFVIVTTNRQVTNGWKRINPNKFDDIELDKFLK